MDTTPQKRKPVLMQLTLRATDITRPTLTLHKHVNVNADNPGFESSQLATFFHINHETDEERQR